MHIKQWELLQLHFFSFKLDVSGKADFAFGVFSHLGAQRAIGNDSTMALLPFYYY